MSIEILAKAPVGLLPVIIFLVVLVYMDSYKLVNLKTILLVIGLGGATAWTAFYVNGWIITGLGMELSEYSRYVAPLVEETLKALVIIYLFRTSRIGFLVDAAIMGFAVGAGFALVENFYYVQVHPEATMAVWVVRGFGTAIMHGGVTAIFAVMSQTLTERHMKINPLLYLPGLLTASILHSIFNHFLVSPILETLGTLLILPPVLGLIYHRSTRAMHQWLEIDFDADTELLGIITSGHFPESKIGMFLNDLKTKFDGPVVVDMLCYLRVYTELAIRAKGLLMLRENGIDIPVGERTHEKFEELHYLEKSIGKTGLLAMKPFLHYERKDLWQIHVLEN
jgi:RsiW-degrading membrane proteinase PrsW (M82 family)